MSLNNIDPSNREAEMAAWSTSSPEHSQARYQQQSSGTSGQDEASEQNATTPTYPTQPAGSADGGDGRNYNSFPAAETEDRSPSNADSGNGGDSGNDGTDTASGDGPGTGPVTGGGDGGSPGGSGGSIFDGLPAVGSIGGGTDTVGGASGATGGVLADASGLVSDIANLPGMILSGDIGGGISQIVSDVSDLAGSLVDTVTGALGGNDALAPVSGLVDDLTGSLQNLPVLDLNGGDTAGASILDLGGSPSGNAVDVAAGPSSDNGTGIGILADPGTGNTAGVHALALGPDGPQILEANLLTGDGDAASLPDLTGTGLSDLTGATANPLLTVNGGNTGDGTGLTVGDLNGSGSGHLINADAGPASDNGTAIDVLSPPGTADHTTDINVVDVGSDGPQLLDAGLLNDADLGGIPGVTGSGLAGDLLDTGNLLDTADLLNTGDGNLVTLNGGNNAGDGGIASADFVNLGGSSSGHLVDADAGPEGSGNSVDVLAAPTGSDNTANVNVVDVGSDGPQLADLGALTDAGLLDIPSLNGTGTDGLTGVTGNLLSTVADQGVPATTATPLGDLGDGLDLLPGLLTGDHGIVDVNGQHII